MTATLDMDKYNWKKYRFDEFAQNVSERVEPAQTDLDLYVGLEHIDPDCLHLSRHGHPSDVEGTKLRFYAGDVIFGRRRAYQRKTALATQDGICSAHAMVLRAKENIVDSRFFPFLFHSKQFIDMAITISVGGLSPTINWKDIAKQEFLLPPLAEQQRLAELLWAADEMIEKEKRELEGVDRMFSLKKSELIWKNDFPQIELNKTTVIGLKDGDWIESKDQSEQGIRLIQLADIGEGIFLDKSQRFISENTFKRLHCFEILPSDILLARMPDPIGRACILPEINEKCITAVDVCIIRVNEKICNRDYLNFLVNTIQLRKTIIENSSGTTRQRISRSNLEKLLIPFPELSIQNKIAKELKCLENVNVELQNQVSKSQEVKQEIINKIF